MLNYIGSIDYNVLLVILGLMANLTNLPLLK